MSNKNRLFEMMGKLDPNFKQKLNEDVYNDAGEPNMTHSQARDYTEPAEPDYNSNNNNSPDEVQDFNSVSKELEHTFDTILRNSNGYKEFLSKNHDIMLYDIDGILELYIDGEKKYHEYIDDINVNDVINIIRPYENTFLKGMDANKDMDAYNSAAAASDINNNSLEDY